jgi:hypothetical protein
LVVGGCIGVWADHVVIKARALRSAELFPGRFALVHGVRCA